MAYSPRFPVTVKNLELLHQGKTRDTFGTKQDNHIAPWASNRISTHDIVHRSEIPEKGQVLTALTIFWLEFLGRYGISHHLVAYGSKIYEYLPGTPREYPDDFHLRTLIVQKKKPLPFEFVRRNFLEGSLYTDYYSKGLPNPYGVDIPPGMERMDMFKGGSIFTPTTKSDEHDMPCVASEVRNRYPIIEATSKRIVAIATEHLLSRGIALVDTKLEFAEDGMLIDEVLTPDSSRFTLLKDIERGKPPRSLDKQVARDEAVRMWSGKERTPITFSDVHVCTMNSIYLNTFEHITGMPLPYFQGTFME